MGGALDGVRVLDMALLANVGSNYLCLGDVPGRWGNAHASIVPYQAFQAADDYLDLATGNDGQWQRFCKVTAVTEWAVDARFARNPQRVAHREALISMPKDLLRQKRVEEWLELCASADVPAGPVNTIDRVFADRQALSRGMLVEMERVETVRLAGSPPNLSETRVQIAPAAPPAGGAHGRDYEPCT